MDGEGDAVTAGRGVSYLWLQNLISSVARIIAFAFFARLISVYEMGLFTVLNLAYGAATMLIGLGLSSVVTKFVAENLAQGRREVAASVYYKSLLVSELASLLVAGGVLFSKFPAGVSSLPNSPLISAIGVLFAVDIIASIGPTASATFYGLLEFRGYALIYGVYTVFRPFMVVLLVYETGSLIGLVEGWLVSDAVFAACVFLYLWHMLGRPVFRFSTKYLLKLSTPLYLANISSFLYGSFDQLTLIPLVSLTTLGVYGAAITAYTAYYGLIAVLGSVLLPVFSGIHGLGGPEGLKRSVRTASRYVSLVAMPMAFALLATARPALTLLVGRSYEGGALPLAVLALASTASIIALSLGPVLIVLNETKLAALASIIPVPLSVALAYLSIPTLGILGASIARGLSMLLSLLLIFTFVRRKISVKLDSQAILKSVAGSVAMAGVMAVLQVWYYSRFLLPVYLLAGFLVYLLAMRTLKAVTKADIDLLQSILGSRSQKMCDLLSRLVVPRKVSVRVGRGDT